jgi:hypothetical protein
MGIRTPFRLQASAVKTIETIRIEFLNFRPYPPVVVIW